MLKNILVSVIALNCLQAPLAFAAQPELDSKTRICLGEFAVSNIVEAAKACSEEDLAKATVVLYQLQHQLADVRGQITKMEEVEKTEKYQKEKRIYNIVTTTGVTAGLIGAGGLMATLAVEEWGSKALQATFKKLKNPLFISFVIGMGLLGAPEGGRDPWNIMTFHVEDIPKLKKEVIKLENEIANRRALLEAAGKIKAGMN